MPGGNQIGAAVYKGILTAVKEDVKFTANIDLEKQTWRKDKN